MTLTTQTQALRAGWLDSLSLDLAFYSQPPSSAFSQNLKLGMNSISHQIIGFEKPLIHEESSQFIWDKKLKFMQVITNDFVLTSENSTELTQLKKLLESARKLLVALAQAKLGSKI